MNVNGVNFLLGSTDIFSASPLRAYDDTAVNFAAEFSQRLRRLPETRTYPDIAALAFWSRRANIERLKQSCPEHNNRLGRGVCFHIAPGNIPVNFAFTYLFGVLAGCVNIVRVPGREFPQIDLILEVLAETLKAAPEVEERSAFVKYPADDGITAEFCKMSDARVIWGGDETVAKIRAMSARPRCIDLCFADRYSVCVISGRAVLEAKDSQLRRLGEDFYNDTYLMDQNACSSPQLILWIDDSPEARLRFWDAVYSAAEKKYNLQAGLCTEKYLNACADAVRLPVKKLTRKTNLLYTLELETLCGNADTLRGKGGYFYECAISGLEDICGIVTRKFQTVTCFGIEPERIRSVVLERRLTGIDRIVPVGRAMDINIIWDGFDIVRILSRIINM